MNYSDLLDRMKKNDTKAFVEMTDQYGWSVYSMIRKKHSDKVIADKVYRETMSTFYQSISKADSGDPVEALLCGYAELVSDKYAPSDTGKRGSQNREQTSASPQVNSCADSYVEKKTSHKKRDFCYDLVMFVLLVAIVVVIWYMIGVLMVLELIPYADLGYSWFNANIMEIF